jgi:hypothetical protein
MNRETRQFILHLIVLSIGVMSAIGVGAELKNGNYIWYNWIFLIGASITIINSIIVLFNNTNNNPTK